MRLRDKEEEVKSAKTIEGLKDRLVKGKIDLRKAEYMCDKAKMGGSKAEVGYVKIGTTECFFKKVPKDMKDKYV